MSDVIVIGAGVNGLACAAELARAGHAITVLEQRAVVGGLCAARDFGSFTVPGVRHDTTELRPAAATALGLELERAPVHAPIYGASKNGLILHHDPARTELSHKDATAYSALRKRLTQLGPLLDGLLSGPAPRLLPSDLGEAFDLGKLALALRLQGRTDMLELLRVAPMCAGDFLREHFDSEILSATLALPAVLGDFVGPWSAGTSAMLLLQQALAVPDLVGGPAAVVSALQRTLSKGGVTIRTQTKVGRLVINNGACNGVVLTSGETLRADAVVACCSPRTALLALLPRGALLLADKQAAQNIRARASVAKVHLGLSAWPLWNGRSEHFTRVRIGATLDDLERAFDAVKYKRVADKPALDMALSEGPGGTCILSIMAFGVPYEAEDDNQILNNVLNVLEAEAPGLRGEVRASEVLCPKTLEAEYGVSGGNLHHVERALDQMLFLRPALPFARNTTPIPGLFLGSSGTHGGPGLTLTPGLLAARAVGATL
jgi:phytoene dehydrogenase-like protein